MLVNVTVLTFIFLECNIIAVLPSMYHFSNLVLFKRCKQQKAPAGHGQKVVNYQLIYFHNHL